MPLISARNPDVMDVANIEDGANSSLLKQSTLTLASAQEDVMSVMTLHSAFQGGADSDVPFSPGKLRNAFNPNNLNSFFRRNRQDTIMIDEHENIALDDFSLNSLPIQDCDVASVEQRWMQEQETIGESIPTMKRNKFSTQTYSNKGTVQSSLRRQIESIKSVDQISETKSTATATLGDNSYVHNSSKSSGAARRLSKNLFEHRPMKSRIEHDASVVEQTLETKRTYRKSQPPKPQASRISNRSSTSSTNDETSSVGSQKTTSSSNQTSESKLDREMFRLSVELASTLANLDVSNIQVARFRNQVRELQETVEKMQNEKEVLKKRLERYEQKKITMTESKQLIEVRRNKDIRHIEPACITPMRGAYAGNEGRGAFFSPGANSSFSDPGANSREESGLLFPNLNESHISCPDLYASRIHDEFGVTIEEEEKDDDQNASVELIDPRDEVFDDDPFATCFNYSNDSSVNKSKDEQDNYDDDDDNHSIYSRAFSISQTIQGGTNTSSLTTVTALLQLTKKLPIFRKKAKDVLNTSIESQISHMRKTSNLAPSKREMSLLNQSNATLNISKLFKLGHGNDDDLSVSIRSQNSRPKFYFGR